MRIGWTSIGGCRLALCAGLLTACHGAALPSIERGKRGGSSVRALPSDLPAPQTLRFQLPNGMHVVLRESRLARVVALQAWIEAGAADEREGEAGVSFACQHLLGAALARRAPSIGATARSWTTPDHSVYQLLVPSLFLDGSLPLLHEALFRPTLDEAQLGQERPSLLAAHRQAEETPARVAAEALLRSAFIAHPYGRSVLGSRKALLDLAAAALSGFHHRRYGAARVTLVLVGDFAALQVRGKIEKLFSPIPPGPRPAVRPSEPPQRGLRVVGGTSEGREAQLLFGFHVPGARSAELSALSLAAALLAAGDEALLPIEVRRNRQAASTVFAHSFMPRDPGLFFVGASLSTAQLTEGARATLGEVLRLAREETSLLLLRRAQQQIEVDWVHQQETAEGAARWLGFFESSAGGADKEARYLREVREMTPSRLQRTLAPYLVPENLTVALLLPRPEAPPPRGPGRRAHVLLDAVSPREPAQAERLLRALIAQLGGKAAAGALPTRAGPVIEHRLRNGARLLIYPDHGAPVVTLHAAWAGGLRAEDERGAGASHLLSRLLCHGTRSRSGEQVAREFEAMGGTVRGESDADTLGLSAEVLSPYWDRGLALFADCLRNPSLPEEEIERARREALAQLDAREDEPGAVALGVFLRALYPRHPYRRDLFGTPASVAALSRRRLLEFYHRRYSPERMTLAVVGDATAAQFIARAEALLAPEGEGGEASSDGMNLAPDAPPAAPIQQFKHMGTQQAHLVLGFPGTRGTASDRHALAVLLEMLGSEDGRLVALREKRPVYQVRVSSLIGVDPGYLAVRLSTSPEQLEAAQAQLRDELRRLVDHPASEGELSRARRRLVLSHEAGLQRRSDLAAALARAEAVGPGWAEPRRYAAALLQVSAADVQRVARHYLDERRSVLVAVLPESATPAAQRRRNTPDQARRR